MTSAGLDKLRARATEVSGLMKTLSHPNRLMIVCELMNGERSVSQIEEASGVRQPVLSRELGRLRDEKLVSTRRESKVVFYSLDDDRLRDLMNVLCRSWGGEPAAADAATAQQSPSEGQAFFPTVEGRKGPRLRIKPDPYRKD